MLVNNIELNVKDSGDGPILVWGHGLMASMEGEEQLNLMKWDEQSTHMRVIRYDARGHGESQATYSPEDYHWKNLGNDMNKLIDFLNLESVIIGGQSMGCATSIYAALENKKAKGMILMNPPTAWETRATQGSLYKRFARIGGLLGGKMLGRLIGRNPERLLPAWLVESEEINITGVIGALGKLKRKTLKNLMNGAALTDLPSPEEIKNIKIPTLILAWEGDASHPVETANRLHEYIEGSKLDIVNDIDGISKWPDLIKDFVTKS